MSEPVTQISVYGALDIRLNEKPIHLCISGTTRSLLQYLLCSQERLSRREKLMDMFWPETQPERQRSSLNSAIWRIKKALRPCPSLSLDATAEYLRFINLQTEYIQIDFIQLENAIRDMEQQSEFCTGHLNQLIIALCECQGEPLDGLEDDWANIERERFSTLRIQGLTLAMHKFSELHQYEKALEISQQILRLDPFRECTLQETLCLHVLSGQRVKALQLFKDFESALLNDIGIEPMIETRALRDYLAGDRHLKANLQFDHIGIIWQANVGHLLNVIESSRDALRVIC